MIRRTTDKICLLQLHIIILMMCKDSSKLASLNQVCSLSHDYTRNLKHQNMLEECMARKKVNDESYDVIQIVKLIPYKNENLQMHSIQISESKACIMKGKEYHTSWMSPT